MSKLRCHISISLDGFAAGPNQSQENPLGEGGMAYPDTLVGTDSHTTMNHQSIE